MKKTLLLLALFIGLFVFNALGQDTLYLKNQQKQNVKILESTHRVVKYQFTNYKNGATFSVNPRRIEKIVYKNGYTDDFGNKNPRKYRPIGVSGGISLFLSDYGGGMFLTSLDYFILPQIDLQLNLGTDLSSYSYYSVGANFHFNTTDSHTRLTPFTGILVGSDAYYYSFRSNGFIQIPVGISYITYMGLSASLSMNARFYFNDIPIIATQLTIGWRFK